VIEVTVTFNNNKKKTPDDDPRIETRVKGNNFNNYNKATIKVVFSCASVGLKLNLI
jgi:hypothetical protein